LTLVNLESSFVSPGNGGRETGSREHRKDAASQEAVSMVDSKESVKKRDIRCLLSLILKEPSCITRIRWLCSTKGFTPDSVRRAVRFFEK
jgi:hypothetical protein